MHKKVTEERVRRALDPAPSLLLSLASSSFLSSPFRVLS